jgi:hypothetical protein
MNAIAFINLNLNEQRYHNEILKAHCRAVHPPPKPNVTRICTKILEAENVCFSVACILTRHQSPIEHVWNALDRLVQLRVPVPDNVQQLCTVVAEEWDNIPQSTA